MKKIINYLYERRYLILFYITVVLLTRLYIVRVINGIG